MSSLAADLVQLEILNDEQSEGTVHGTPGFNAEEDAEKIREAVRGIGTDEKVIIEVLTARRNKQRQEIKRAYKQLYGRDLAEDMRSDLSYNFLKVILALIEPPYALLAKALYNAITGIGTNERVISEIMCSYTNSEIRSIKAVFKKMYDVELEEALKGDTSGDYQRLLVSLCNADRDESEEINLREAADDASKLWNAGEGKFGTDEEEFNHIFCMRSYPQLRAVFSEYFQLTGIDISESIEKEFSGDMKQALLAIVITARCRPAFYAIRLKESMKGLGTDEGTLIRLIVSRSEADMVQVKKAFNHLYKDTLCQWVADDTSGDFRDTLLELL